MTTLESSPDSFTPLSRHVDMLMQTLPAQYPKADVMNYIIRWFGQPNVLSNLFTHILASEALMTHVASQSYGHNNRFMKLVLFRSADGHQLRVHARWPTPSGFKEDLAHNHHC